jgi:hypothetical protein
MADEGPACTEARCPDKGKPMPQVGQVTEKGRPFLFYQCPSCRQTTTRSAWSSPPRSVMSDRPPGPLPFRSLVEALAGGAAAIKAASGIDTTRLLQQIASARRAPEAAAPASMSMPWRATTAA